jgi:phosphoglycolate phosphatase
VKAFDETMRGHAIKAPAQPEMVIFDFDGTLADSIAWMMRVFNSIAAKHRFRQVTEAEIETLRGRSNREIIKYLGVSNWRLPLIARHVRRLNAESLHEIPLFEGIDQMLAELSASGVAIAVVSSNAEANVRTVLGPSQAFITEFVCGVSLFGKTAKLRKLVRRGGHDPRTVLAVGDEVRDIEAARGAGLPCAAVGWGYATPELLQVSSPSIFFGSVEEMRRYFAGGAAL